MTDPANPAPPPDPMSTTDSAGKAYWDALWRSGELPSPPRGYDDLGHVEQHFAALLEDVLDGAVRPSILEIGCARSIWLPYLARVCGADVTGIDYSETGCLQARALLAKADVDGDVVCCDAFTPPSRLLHAFDLVFSFGVIEHFAEPHVAVAAFARYLKPGGKLLTIVPNMRGTIGLVERLVNPSVYSLHERLSPEDLAEASRRAGLIDVEARYFVGTNFGVLNVVGLEDSPATRAKALLLRVLTKTSAVAWRLERVVAIPATRWFAGYVCCIASARVGRKGTGSGVAAAVST